MSQSKIFEGGDNVEYIGRYSPNEIGRAICSLLNEDGGRVIVGMESNEKIRGIGNAEGKRAMIQADVLSRIAPQASISVSVQPIGGKDCIIVDVPPGADLPYAFNDRIFTHQNRDVGEVKPDQLVEMITKRSKLESRWERGPATGVEIDDLDADEIHITYSGAHSRMSRVPNTASTLEMLEWLGVVERGLVRNSAAFLFYRDVSRLYPQTRVRAIAHSHEDPTQISDNRLIEGHAFELINEIESFLRRNVAITSQLSSAGFARTDKLAYPWGALREGIMNALTHRDYSNYNDMISIVIRKNSVQIWNPGILPEGMTLEDLPRGDISRPRNPDMAHVFFLRGLIERVGIGTRRIVQECRSAGLPAPIWEIRGGGISLTLLREPAPETLPRRRIIRPSRVEK